MYIYIITICGYDVNVGVTKLC